MKIFNLCTALFVKNIEISKEFYTQVMGFNIEHDFGKNVSFKEGFAIWEIKESHIIPEKLGADKISDKNHKRFELYFETKNIEEVENTLKQNKVKFLHEIHEEPWKQFTLRFFDPDEHLIEVGETLESLVKRLFVSGLSKKEIVNTTHIPIEDVEKLLEKQ